MIVKAAFLLFRDVEDKKELLFVRTNNKPYLVLPGGKQEAKETVEEALQRELQEELGTNAENIKRLGVVSGQTPDGRDMVMHLFAGALEAVPQP